MNHAIISRVVLLGLLPMIGTLRTTVAAPPPTTNIDQLSVHDPCILADPTTHRYYIYAGYSPRRSWEHLQSPHGRAGVQAWVSSDLKTWTGPQLVFEVPAGFWADPTDAPWAPEVHYYRGKYYLFVTFNDWNTVMETIPGRPPITKRGSQILVGDSPLGPFRPLANHPTTPPGEMTLDATFWVQDGQPWLVYSHEWVQVTDGTIEAVRLKPDLAGTVGRPITLIRAGDVSWTKREIRYRNGPPVPGIVTDGPYLYQTRTGVLVLLWSSWSKKHKYATAIATSSSGRLQGPWVHEPQPILQDDRGHGAIFRSFDGRLLLVLHRYFHQPATRVQIWGLRDVGRTVVVTHQLLGAP